MEAALRIIGGEARGRALTAPRGMETRPTQDRVKESLFNILGVRVRGAHVLDLFAGSGALGLEALSRGAAEAVFADSGRPAQAAVLRNIEALGFAQRTLLLRCDWRAALRRLAAQGRRFDLMFLDPPYRMPGADAVLEALWDVAAEDALAVFEHDRRLPPAPGGWTARDVRGYGDTALTFFQAAKEARTDADGALSGKL